MLSETQWLSLQPTNMLSHIILISSCFLDAMLMLSFVQIFLEVSGTSTSTFPRVLIVPPLLSLQMVTFMRYTIIKTAATLVLLKQCGEFSNSLYTAALQLSTGFSCIFKERIKSILIQTNPLRLHSNVQQTRGPCWMHFTE